MAMQTRVTAADLKPPISVQEWGELEGPPHYELVEGHLMEMPDVAFWHDILLFNLFGFLHPYVKRHQLGLIVGSTAKLKVSALTGRQPDLFFLPKELYHLVGRNLFKGIPPLVIEILSPRNEDTDRIVKYHEYARLGVGQYWIVDAPNRRFEVYRHRGGDNGANTYELLETVSGDAIFRPSLFPGLEIPLAEIWPTEFENRTDE